MSRKANILELASAFSLRKSLEGALNYAIPIIFRSISAESKYVFYISRIMEFSVNLFLTLLRQAPWHELASTITRQKISTNLIEGNLGANPTRLDLFRILVLDSINEIISKIIWERKGKSKLINLLKLLMTIKGLLEIIYLFRYIVRDKYLYFSPIQHILGIICAGGHIPNTTPAGSGSERLGRIGGQIVQYIGILGYVGFKIGEWWVNRGRPNVSREEVRIAPPVGIKLQVEIDMNKCPICGNGMKLDEGESLGCLETSGFIFCYKCITQYITKYNVCPVTQIPTTFMHIRPIYK